MSILDPKKHERLIAGMDDVVYRSGVSRRFIESTAVDHCGKAELEWLIHFHDQGLPGLKLLGPRSIERCMALGGALIRNWIDARVRTLDQMLDDPADATVLICPNFYLAHAGKSMPAWRTQKLYDLLITRFQADQPTVLWVESDLGLKDYGQAMYDLLQGYRLGSSS
jgi:hypothetical protein